MRSLRKLDKGYMTITFQIQIDPVDVNKEFNDKEIEMMSISMESFVSVLKYLTGEYIRYQMYVNEKIIHRME
jgi:hypothetical protein